MLLHIPLILCADGDHAAGQLQRAKIPPARILRGSRGYVESILDQALEAVPEKREYVFRLDDDEALSPALLTWLSSGAWRQQEIWTFPRAHLWPQVGRYITSPPLWPDYQTRLSVVEKASRDSRIHATPAFGTGTIAPAAIEHHTLLLRDRTERAFKADQYEQLQAGAGSGAVRLCQVPEEIPGGPKTSLYVEGAVPA